MQRYVQLTNHFITLASDSLQIQLEDIGDQQKSLTYIGRLEFKEANHNVKKYGKLLMSEAPQQTTELLKRLCTDYKPSDSMSTSHM